MRPGNPGKPQKNPRVLDLRVYFVPTREQRDELKKPWGPVLTEKQLINSRPKSSSICVGDRTAHTFLKNNLPHKLLIIDGIIERKPRPANWNISAEKTIKTENPPGIIAQQANNAIKYALKEKATVLIDVFGEEDLLVIPAILHAPENTSIYYGQPGKGIVHLIVTANLKSNIEQMITHDQRKPNADNTVNESESTPSGN